MNQCELKAEIIRNGMSVPEFANRLGMCRSTFYRKLNGKQEFTQGEISMMIEALKLRPDRTMAIFFANAVS